MSAALQAHVDVVRGSLRLDVALTVDVGQVLAVVGPNGAGKTTLLRALAGLQPLDGGNITLGDVVLDDPEQGTFVPAERRQVGVVFQDYLLFAHLSALDNVAFGRRARGMAKRDARDVARGWLDRFGLADHAHHRPPMLSGGQQQRVALARALATGPDLLLLDEPLAALDAGTHAEVRRELRGHLADFGGVTIVVTHDPLDAYALADRVVVIEEGRITHTGTLATIAAQPRSRYVAQLVGTNLLHGRITDDGFVLDGGHTLIVDDPHRGPAYAAIAPAAIALYTAPPTGSPRNVWRTTIADIDHSLDRVRVTLGAPLPLTAELTTAGLATLQRHPGDEVWGSVKATEVVTYPA